MISPKTTKKINKWFNFFTENYQEGQQKVYFFTENCHEDQQKV